MTGTTTLLCSAIFGGHGLCLRYAPLSLKGNTLAIWLMVVKFMCPISLFDSEFAVEMLMIVGLFCFLIVGVLSVARRASVGLHATAQ